MANNESMEMYLETIFLIEKNHGHAHNVDVAKELGVSKASVSKAMKTLKAKGYVSNETYGTITLTDEGRKISERIFRNHKLISLFLEHSLELQTEEASENACKIEHVLSENMVKAIQKYLTKNNISFE